MENKGREKTEDSTKKRGGRGGDCFFLGGLTPNFKITIKTKTIYSQTMMLGSVRFQRRRNTAPSLTP